VSDISRPAVGIDSTVGECGISKKAALIVSPGITIDVCNPTCDP